ncbi:MAG: hypothetical protein R3D78_03750 [Paracoccaceae bacterium]|jgi:hypothetical protein
MKQLLFAALVLAGAGLVPAGARAMCDEHAALSCPEGHSWNPETKACEAMSS